MTRDDEIDIYAITWKLWLQAVRDSARAPSKKNARRKANLMAAVERLSEALV